MLFIFMLVLFNGNFLHLMNNFCFASYTCFTYVSNDIIMKYIPPNPRIYVVNIFHFFYRNLTGY